MILMIVVMSTYLVVYTGSYSTIGCRDCYL
jgi:hypothetical protein